MADRQTVSTGSPWEERYGYSRALRAGNMVYSAGTLPIGNDGEVIAPHCAHQQTLAAFRKALTAIEQLGASANDVVRCRMYVRHMNDQVEVGRAMHELFSKVRPVATMIGGVDLAHPSALVEIEIEAVLDA